MFPGCLKGQSAADNARFRHRGKDVLIGTAPKYGSCTIGIREAAGPFDRKKTDLGG